MTQPIRQGDCISVIAARSGVPWRKIWDASENDPLREAGRHPNVLLPGDALHVPARQQGRVLLATDQIHHVVLQELLATVHIRLVASLEPLADEPWEIEHPGGKLEGTSDGEGKLQAKLPVRLERATLSLPKRRQRYTLVLGALDPVETSSGAQSRLRSLGLTTSERINEPELAEVLRGFQRSNGIDESAELDDATIDALRDEYGI